MILIKLFLTFMFLDVLASQTQALCDLPRNKKKFDYFSNDHKSLPSPIAQFDSLELKYLNLRGHRSRPNDYIQLNNGDSLIAWGDLGLVFFSHHHQQVIDEIPLFRIMGDHFRGELLGIKKESDQEQVVELTYFNDAALKYQKALFSLDRYEVIEKLDCYF